MGTLITRQERPSQLVLVERRKEFLAGVSPGLRGIDLISLDTVSFFFNLNPLQMSGPVYIYSCVCAFVCL